MEESILRALAQYGPLGIFAAIFVWMYVKKDGQVETARSEYNKELKEIYKEVKALVVEVSKALSDKSTSDEKLADAIEALNRTIQEDRREKR